MVFPAERTQLLGLKPFLPAGRKRRNLNKTYKVSDKGDLAND